MKDCNLGDYLMFQCKLMECMGVNPGRKEVVLRSVHDIYCPHCHESIGKEYVHVIVDSPLFQEGAVAIQTISESNKQGIVKTD